MSLYISNIGQSRRLDLTQVRSFVFDSSALKSSFILGKSLWFQSDCIQLWKQNDWPCFWMKIIQLENFHRLATKKYKHKSKLLEIEKGL